MEAWKQRRLDDVEVVCLWVDRVYVKAGLEDGCQSHASNRHRKAAVLVALQSGHRESTASWASVLRDLRSRGLRAPRLVIGDGHLGIWGGLREIYPEAAEQRCWNHRILNILDRIGKRDQPSAKELLRTMVYADTVQQAEREKASFQRWCRAHGYDDAAELIDQDWDRMTAFYAFPQEHWPHLRTTNPVESPFAALRLRTDAAKRFKKVENGYSFLYEQQAFGCVPRAKFLQALGAEGIPAGGGYSHPLYKNPLFTERRFGRIAELVDFPDYRSAYCPNCERLCREKVSISQQCLLGTREDMRDIVGAMEKLSEHLDELQ